MAEHAEVRLMDRWRRTRDGAEFWVTELWSSMEGRPATEVKLLNVDTGRGHSAPIAGFLQRHTLEERPGC